MHNRVFVLDTTRKPLAPCHPARARELLRKGKAAIFKRYPFTIILNHKVENAKTDNLEVKLDPGSKTTGLAILSSGKRGVRCIFGLNIVHRSKNIVQELLTRRSIRISRRHRKTRYREPRFDNRTRPKGWLAPSVRSRLENIRAWLTRIVKLTGLIKGWYENIRFDTQKMMNPDIKGTEYQQGTLYGYEIKEYLLEKYHHTCQYCKGESNSVILEVEHISPKSKGGTNKLSNLTLACHKCNTAKGNKSLSEWLIFCTKIKNKLNLVRTTNIPKVMTQKNITLKDAAHVNIIRNRLPELFLFLGIEVQTAYGYVTKYNRSQQKYHKDHWIDAACVGDTGERVYIPFGMKCLTAKANKNNNRQMQHMDKYGFPRTSPKGPSNIHGFSTGDIVKAVTEIGKHVGTHVGKVIIRKIGNFTVNRVDITYKKMINLHKKDGYSYTYGTEQIINIFHSLSKSIFSIVNTKYLLIKQDRHNSNMNSIVRINL